MRGLLMILVMTVAVAPLNASAAPVSIVDTAIHDGKQFEANKTLITELEGMYAVEIAMRRQFLALRAKATDEQREQLTAVYRRYYEPIDREHTERLKVLLKGRGWFRISEVGAEVAGDALTIANHSPDFAFQEQVVALLDQLPAEERPSDYANIWDRVALQEGRLQRYGTQDFRCVDGHNAPSDRIEDPAHLEERRAAVGIEPMADNLAAMDKIYGRCSEAVDRPPSQKH